MKDKDITLSREQIISQLKEQLDALRLFTKEYDNGKYFLFKEIAVKLRILFHNAPNGRSRSLCHQLNLESIQLYDSAKLIRDQATNSIKAPVHFRFNVDIPLIFQPDLLPGLFKSDFPYWWEKGLIIIDKNQKEFTRQAIVRYVTDNDGGAHVDVSLPEQYYDLTRGNSSGWSYKISDEEEKYIDPVPAVIRQIAHEVLQTFEGLVLE
jgi:hypothetical protein